MSVRKEEAMKPKGSRVVRAWAVIDEESGSFMIPIGYQRTAGLPVAFKTKYLPLIYGERLIRVEIHQVGPRRKKVVR